MTGCVTLSEQPPFVTLSEVEGVCHVERPTGVETSRFLDYARNDREISRFADALSKWQWEILRLVALAQNDGLCHLERATTICHPERSRRVCHVERPTGVETSRFLDYARNDREISRFADALSKWQWEILRLVALAQNDGLCHLERATTICHPERSRRVCHVKRPTGVETSRFLDYARNDSGGVFQNEKAVIFQILQFEGFAWWCKQFGSFHCVRLACF